MKKGPANEDDLVEMFRRDAEKYPLLTKKEERAIAEKAVMGDMEARNALVTANLRFVFTVVHRYWKPGRPKMDMLSEGALGLMRAAEIFDPWKFEVRFISYAGCGIEQRIWRLLKIHWRHDADSLDDPIFKDGVQSKLDLLESKEAPVEEENLHGQPGKWMKLLDEREREIIKLRFWEDLTLEEAGKKIGLSRNRTREVEAKALRKMRWGTRGLEEAF